MQCTPSHQLVQIFHHAGMYARKWPLPLCVLCGFNSKALRTVDGVRNMDLHNLHVSPRDQQHLNRVVEAAFIYRFSPFTRTWVGMSKDIYLPIQYVSLFSRTQRTDRHA